MTDNKKPEEKKQSSSYEKFLIINRARNNQAINKVMWLCILVGPLIALGLYTGVFENVRYTSCFYISFFQAILSLIHLLLYKKLPASRITSYFCLLTMDALLYYMSCMKVDIQITYFIIPLISLFFCDKKIYLVSGFVNFIMMILSVLDFPLLMNNKDAMKPLVLQIPGYTIEYLVMFFAGYSLCSIITSYYQTMYEDKKALKKGEKAIQEIEIRERNLIQISNTDELTSVYNRHAYEDDLAEVEINENIVVIVIDINGLKATNDTLGHDAGDELIIGTAQCVASVFNSCGKVYRIGGDEFVVIFESDRNQLPFYQYNFERAKREWMGHKIEELSLSVGYATARENPDLSIFELVRIADRKMYADKEEYYRSHGIERRKY